MRANRISFAFNIRVGCVIVVVAVSYASGFGGFWLGDDIANIAHLYDLEQQGRLSRRTLAYFASGMSPAGSAFDGQSGRELCSCRPQLWRAVFSRLRSHLANVLLIALVVRRISLVV
jgi:hypothetical protein